MKDSKIIKNKRGVLISLVQYPDGLRLSLDDAELQGGVPAIWRQSDHFTSKPLSEETLQKLEFDEKELADFGYHILSRLYAFNSLGES